MFDRLKRRLLGRLLRGAGCIAQPIDQFRTACRIAGEANGGKPANLVFDVGANRGDRSRALARNFPTAQIHAFEPFPPTFEVLSRETAAEPRIRCVPVALSTTDGKASLHSNQSSETNSLLSTHERASDYSPPGTTGLLGNVEIQTKRLDTYCAEQRIERIDFLKVDCQGFDLQVLLGAGDLLNPKTLGAIFVEVLFVPLYEKQAYFEDIHRALTERGYGLVDLFDKKQGKPQPCLNWCDALYVGR
jgi:FkbM family methyltransferase